MENNQDKILALKEFISINKFSDEMWNRRMLNPSAPELCQYLEKVFNYNAHLLIEALEKNASEGKLRAILKRRLALCNSRDYDTEEKEFICELFAELARIVGVNISSSLNNWLYSRPLMWLIKIVRFLRPRKPETIEIQKQPCTKCGVELEAHLTKQEGLPEMSWVIGRCDKCKEYNLVSHGPNNKMCSYKNYEPVEYLSKEEFSYDQALSRLEQIKVFRK